MKVVRNFLFLSVVLFAVASAVGQDVHYNYARGTNFAAYKTYEWVVVPAAPTKIDPPPGLPALPGGPPAMQNLGSEDQLVDQAIKRAIDEQLAQKGLKLVEKNGDLQVVYHAALREERSINLLGSGWRGGGIGMWDGSVQGQTSTIPVGTLVVDLYDPAANQLVWRGDASKSLDIKKDPDKNYKTLQKAMAKLFKNYPPPAK